GRWRMVPQASSVGSPDALSGPEAATARDALVEVIMGREVEAWRAWHRTRRDEPAQWREASVESTSAAIWLTAEELAAFKEELEELGRRRIPAPLHRMDRARRPARSRPGRLAPRRLPRGP